MALRAVIPSIVAVLTLAGAGFAFVSWHRGREQARLLKDARASLALEDFAGAGRLARAALGRDPASTEALGIAGEAALKAARYDEAAEWFSRLPDGNRRALAAYLKGARSAVRSADLSEAEGLFRSALRLDERHAEANRELAKLLSAQGRRREAASFQFRLLQAERFSVEELLLLSNSEEPYFDQALIDRARAANPDDPVPLIGTAVAKLAENRPAEAADLLRQVVEKVPSQPQAQALLGQALFDVGATDEWLRRQKALPAGCDESPDLWFVRGSWAERGGRKEEAVRCYWEAVRRDPNHRRANFSLGQVLAALGRVDDAAPFLKRAGLLSELHDQLHPIFLSGPTPAVMSRAGELMERLGRPWEAWAWHLAVTTFEPQNAAATRERDRLAGIIRTKRPPRTLPEANPAVRLDLSRYPLPSWSESPASQNRLASPSESRPAFEDVAARVGVDFRYFNDGTPGREGNRMIQTTGGGVAVFDLDADGRPDLHFTQGSRWPPRPGQTEHLDRCFRNLGGRFSDVAALAGLADDRYGQGVAAGDLDGDGFADLYVANIGGNRLYHSHGDGTFADVAEAAGVAADLWTTSCVMADLDGDALPDLYDVNYLRGEDVFERLCGTPLQRACAPEGFDGSPDRICRNLGDGRWADVSSAAGVGRPPGKGLGIVAADFDGSGRLDLFVANDTEANYLFLNRTPSPGRPPLFSEEALSTGVALDRDGRTQACMGVACDDGDGDGLLDLFVTNFYKESNTLYVQQPGGLFLDETREAGLREPSWDMLGFGTQFLDAELDGLPDLVIANGHIDDFTHRGAPFRMRPQFFRNLGGRFAESPAETLGPWFQGEHLGRGLARLDWNRDGLEDFAVSQIDEPTALAENRTAEVGRFVAVRLVGVHGEREAVGATVTAKAGDRTRVRQLTAGDGYMASNERRLVFGLGEHEQADELTVRWPSGLTQTFREVAAGREYLIIEGRDAPLLLPADRPAP